MPGTPPARLGQSADRAAPGFHARDHVRHVERGLDDLGEEVLGIAVEHPLSETAAELKPHVDDIFVYGDRSEDIGSDPCSRYVGPGQFRQLQELSSEGEHLMPRLTTVLGGLLRSDFVVPEGLDPLLTVARIVIVAAQKVQI